MPRPRRVLITIRNLFHGSHIVDQFLSCSISVRAVVHDEPTQNILYQTFYDACTKGALDIVLVPDISAPNAFFDALAITPNPFDVVIHTAGPAFSTTGHDNTEIATFASFYTTTLLQHIAALAPQVRRFILNTAVSAAPLLLWQPSLDGSPATPVAAPLDEASLVPAWEMVRQQAEAPAWRFVEEARPGFDVVTLAAAAVYGPPKSGVRSLDELDEGDFRVWREFMCAGGWAAQVPGNGMYCYADVRDLAFAHCQAAFISQAGNQRFIICAGALSAQTICDVLRRHVPELRDRVPKGSPGTSSLPPNLPRPDATATSALLGLIKYHSVEETLVPLARWLLGIERQQQMQQPGMAFVQRFG
ncbi:putative dihydroflavonal-4-reductase [Lineolata rhizophorae]|uniref:Putative dihydroflavonal-4-reductase n=1 Tax=Lineolata rhizophorae TaxID=578093 RepID=A0A6A6NU71_9PEZI|nr:putative dihydroflavonal-4-reductase [Lineolata rhizophorae]